ncbi:Rv3235 family protein [Mobilicoccus caccae]|uniref:3-hydroxyacyl-CoA dehydrogenase n=1 Tax=Mobilicoccus caccae TaxID=1859295 RepID=A0ABQ6IQI6_9MICO|nr:Rv3235 family protein [Mobilicoccus caccae]GMA38992.1 hypothetical protein GCM10025883_10370 [Mobilicoccus caccae]
MTAVHAVHTGLAVQAYRPAIRIHPLAEAAPRAAGSEASTDHPREGAPTLRLVDDFGPIGTALSALPDPHDWTCRVAVALYEAAIGARPATQVMRWLGPHVYDSVVRRSGRAARRGGNTRRPIRLRRVRATVVTQTEDTSIVEACAVLDDHQRVRVMALRLEGLDGRWLVTACEIG